MMQHILFSHKTKNISVEAIEDFEDNVTPEVIEESFQLWLQEQTKSENKWTPLSDDDIYFMLNSGPPTGEEE